MGSARGPSLGREGGGGGKSARAGSGAHRGAPRRRTRPQTPSPWLLPRRHGPGGASSGAVRGARDLRPHDDPTPGLQRLGRSEDGKAARSRGRFADWAAVSGRGEGVPSASGPRQPLSALRVPRSPELPHPEPRPAHRARPRPAPQPRIRAAGPVPAFGPVARSSPRTSPEERATRRREEDKERGLIGLEEFCPLV